MVQYQKFVHHILQEHAVETQFEGVQDIKRILDKVVRESGRETEGFREAQRFIHEEGWELLAPQSLGDHLLWVLVKRSARQSEIQDIKRILDDVVSEDGRETEGFREAQRFIHEEGWELLGPQCLGDHLVWILVKPKD